MVGTTMRRLGAAGGALALALACGCSSKDEPKTNPIPDVPSERDPGETLTLSLTLDDLDNLSEALAERREDTADELREQHAPEFEADRSPTVLETCPDVSDQALCGCAFAR